jgi:hypothetical protein
MFLTEGHNDESSVNLGNHHDSKNKRLKNSYLLKHLGVWCIPVVLGTGTLNEAKESFEPRSLRQPRQHCEIPPAKQTKGPFFM